MSGTFHDGKWYENTDMICRRCKMPVYQSDIEGYVYQCFTCDEDLVSFEVEEQSGLYLPRVMIARPMGGITINEQIEYLQDENELRVFSNQPKAEAFLLSVGFSPDDLEHFYFVEYAERLTCLNCGHKFELEGASLDSYGWHTDCPACGGSFDIDLPLRGAKEKTNG